MNVFLCGCLGLVGCVCVCVCVCLRDCVTVWVCLVVFNFHVEANGRAIVPENYHQRQALQATFKRQDHN